jgi:IclR helix-turn-helix domain
MLDCATEKQPYRRLSASDMMILMSDNQQMTISITLSPTQIDEIVRAASHSRAPSLSTVITQSLSAPLRGRDVSASLPSSIDQPQMPAAGYLPSDTSDSRLSRSLLRGLSILTCFGPEGASRGIVELAGDLGMSPSTAHRYALTLVELGLLERCPRSRKYRLPGMSE